MIILLQEILEEIEEERQKQALPREDLVESEEVDSGIVVVACKDECSCMQLEDFIANGPQKVFNFHFFLKTFFSKFLSFIWSKSKPS